MFGEVVAPGERHGAWRGHWPVACRRGQGDQPAAVGIERQRDDRGTVLACRFNRRIAASGALAREFEQRRHQARQRDALRRRRPGNHGRKSIGIGAQALRIGRWDQHVSNPRGEVVAPLVHHLQLRRGEAHALHHVGSELPFGARVQVRDRALERQVGQPARHRQPADAQALEARQAGGLTQLRVDVQPAAEGAAVDPAARLQRGAPVVQHDPRRGATQPFRGFPAKQVEIGLREIQVTQRTALAPVRIVTLEDAPRLFDVGH